MKKLIAVTLMLLSTSAFAIGDNPNGEQVRIKTNGINYKKFHKKQHKAHIKRNKKCILWYFDKL